MSPFDKLKVTKKKSDKQISKFHELEQITRITQ